MPERLARLPARRVAGGFLVAEARSVRSRLLGLAGLEAIPANWGLLLPGCRAIHTFGMRFALDVVFLDEAGEVARVARAVPPNRFASSRRASAVLELAAGRADAFLARAGDCRLMRA